MTAMAIVALGGLFSGCTREIEGGEGNSAAFDIVQNYETAFIDRFGQPAETQTWGFGPLTTRAVVDQPSVSEGEYTYNAQMTLAWQGVDAAITSGTSESNFEFMGEQSPWRNSGWSDKYYDVHGTVVASDLSDEFIAAATEVIVGSNGNPGLIPEQGSIPNAENNLSKAESTGYSIVTTGGPVTLTPIYHNSNSGDRLSYYYYPAGSRPSDAEIKTMPKYSLGEMSNPSQGGNTHIYRNTYSLVYVRPDGSCTYDFPANYVINFVISNTWGGQSKEIYQSGGITTTEGGTEATQTSQGKYQVAADRYYNLGETVDTDIAEIRFGNAPSIPQFTMTNGAVQGFNSGSNRNSYFQYRVDGNTVDGDLNGGSTAYYFQPTENGTIFIGVSLNANKRFYIVDLGVDGWNNTSGTPLDGYNGITVNNKYVGPYSFSVEKDHVYAVYASGSKLGFYGFEFYYKVWEPSWNSYREETEINGVFTGTMGPFNCGDQFGLGKVNIRLGRKPTFEKSKSNGQVNGYTALTEGTGVDGDLNTPRATVYYIKPKSSGEMEVAVALNAGKQFYIKDLSNNATSLANYDGITVGEKYYGTYRFPVEAGHEYAIYAAGSKLGFYGCELYTVTPGTPGTPTTTDIVKRTISVKPDYYSDSNLNQEIHQTGYGYGVGGYGVTEKLTSHTAVYKSKVNNVDYTFVGFEDWIDFDFNDVILAITGTEPEKPHDPIVIPDPDPVPDPEPVCRIVAEDLTVDENGDFDFNDVVFDVCPVSSENKTILIIRAVGGELPLYIGSFDEAHEVHNVCNLGPMQMTNTGWDGAIDYNRECGRITLEGQVIASRSDARNITIWVVKKNETITLSADPGRVPSKICVGTDYRWCRERVDIDDTYCKDGVKLFSAYVSGQLGDDWYKQ